MEFVAQWLERSVVAREVAGSIPVVLPLLRSNMRTVLLSYQEGSSELREHLSTAYMGSMEIHGHAWAVLTTKTALEVLNEAEKFMGDSWAIAVEVFGEVAFTTSMSPEVFERIYS